MSDGVGVAVGVRVGVGVGVEVGVGVGVGVTVGASETSSLIAVAPALTAVPVGTLEAKALSTAIKAGPPARRALYCLWLAIGRFLPSSSRKNFLSGVWMNLDPAALAIERVAQVPGSRSREAVG